MRLILDDLKVKLYARRAGVSLQDVAAAAGITYTHMLTLWERDHARLSYVNNMALFFSEKLGRSVDPASLLSYVGEDGELLDDEGAPLSVDREAEILRALVPA